MIKKNAVPRLKPIDTYMLKQTKMKIAAIDIGSNAARLLINEVKINNKQPEFIKLNLLRIPLRLGMDVFTLGKIGEERENGD